jgi:hypothetical protein
LYLGTCALVARRLATIFRSRALGFCAYGCAALNPVLLVHTTEVLTDLLSAVLIQLAVALSWKRPDESVPGPLLPLPAARGEGRGEGLRPRLRQPFLAFLCAGCAAAVRPANAAVAAALAVVWLVRAVRWRDVGLRSIGAALAGLVPPLLPQLLINVRVFGRWTPLLANPLYEQQTRWGMGGLKYATLVVPGRTPFLIYPNPFYRGDPDPISFLRHHPFSYLATLAAHGFALIDADLPYTYVTDLDPWYRWPITLAGCVILFLALVGAATAAIHAGRLERTRALDEEGFVFLSTAIVAAAYVVVYLPVEVEARFGLPVYLLATPFAAAGLYALARGGSTRLRWLALAAAPAFLAGAIVLSSWFAGLRKNPQIPSPANASTMDPHRAHGVRP